jgi:hypothetical protein
METKEGVHVVTKRCYKASCMLIYGKAGPQGETGVVIVRAYHVLDKSALYVVVTLSPYLEYAYHGIRNNSIR